MFVGSRVPGFFILFGKAAASEAWCFCGLGFKVMGCGGSRLLDLGPWMSLWGFRVPGFGLSDLGLTPHTESMGRRTWGTCLESGLKFVVCLRKLRVR